MLSSVEVCKDSFGCLPDGTAIEKYTLKSKTMSASMITFGASLQSLIVPDRSGKLGEVILGFDTIEGYLDNKGLYSGASVGRVANRLEDGRLVLDGKTYNISVNNPPCSLHGGEIGWSFLVWNPLQPKKTAEYSEVSFSLTSPDGDMGYPGTVDVIVTYRLYGSKNKLEILFNATTDRPTAMNLTNHAYFNLSGASTILDHKLKMNAPFYTPMSNKVVPYGEILSVKGTPLDFLSTKKIGQDIMNKEFDQFKIAHPEHGGYDVNVVLDNSCINVDGVRKAAILSDDTTGRVMEMTTDTPGLQIYSSNWFSNIKGRSGVIHDKFSYIALEPQSFPNGPNIAHFPSIRVNPGQTYKRYIGFEFSTL